MTVHEFGKENEQVVVLIHPALVMWDYFEYVIPLMKDRYHLIVPALPGYDEDLPGDYTSVEEIAAELSDWLASREITKVSCIYGCSMGGAIVARILADNSIKVRSAVMDGGITPYQLPWIATRFIAVKDFLLIYLGKLGGVKLLEKAFSTDQYSDEDIRYIDKVLKYVSAKTIWRTFESSNNYDMPKKIHTDCAHIEYWYARAEEKDRKLDIAYIKKRFPQTFFKVFEGTGHGGLATLRPELLVSELKRTMGEQQ
jgi:pimeloyl-ACP methyl ester carboxylesterase